MNLLILALALAANPDGSTNQWPTLAITHIARDATGPIYLKVAAGDLDGDGLADEAILKLRCDSGTVADARFIVSPRDAATGQASGKRMHKPMRVVKEWDAATPQLRALKTGYDVKKVEGARIAADAEGWTAITLGNSAGLCPAVEAARATKSRSNIQNN